MEQTPDSLQPQVNNLIVRCSFHPPVGFILQNHLVPLNESLDLGIMLLGLKGISLNGTSSYRCVACRS